MTPPIDRRRFLHDSAALAASLSAFAAATADDARAADPDPAPAPGSPNEVLRVAVVGVRGRGNEHIAGWAANRKDVRITTICDADENVIGKAMNTVTELNGSKPAFVQDFRKLLDDKNIDVISIATPNHWHSLMSIWACQAGKDVYVEKPVSHNVWEGRKMVEAARKYDRIVQAGTQCRSHQGIRDAMAFLHSGGIGQIYMAKGLCYKPRGSIGVKPDSPAPAGLDYNLWTGPAEMKPYNENRLHYNWHWFWNTGNGDLGNQGIHQMDLARWGIQKSEFPRTVQASGGRLGYKDQAETPNTLAVQFEYDDCLLQFEVRGLYTNDELDVRIGDIFYGTEGVLAINSYTSWQAFMGEKLEPGKSGKGGGDHFANFVAAVRKRDRTLLNGEIEEGHISSAYCHLGNIAYKLGRKLTINTSTESFVNDSQADAMLTREYRAPFIVPDKV